MNTDSRYAQSGVDEPKEQAALALMLKHFAKTYSVRNGVGSVITDSDHFASVIRLTGGLGLAVSTDGVGTKLLLAQSLKRYREIAHDLVANNVNDILCVGATPIALVDYIGIDIVDEKFMSEFAEGLSDAAVTAGVAIVGGEIAQIGEMLNPTHSAPKFDVVATAIGLCSLSDDASSEWPRALDRSNVAPGDVLIGLPSSGLHSNGFSLARKVLIDEGGLELLGTHAQLGGQGLGDVLLTPTRIYVAPILPLLKRGFITGLANISGGGLLTVSRLNPRLKFAISTIPTCQPIFNLIQQVGNLTDAEMFSTFNMGVGMVIAVRKEHVQDAMALLVSLKEAPFVIGDVVEPTAAGEVIIESVRLRGLNHSFQKY